MHESLGLRLLRAFYSLVLRLLMPLMLIRLALRGLDQRDYLKRWAERFGRFPDPGLRDTIWVHAVSVGETNAAAPLLAALRERWPGHRIVVTSITPTGSARVRKLWGDAVFHVYLPYDLPGPVNRFLDRIRPALAVIMETEIWPNLFRACRQRGVPVVVANARLSARSLHGYGPVRPLAREAIRSAALVAAQSAADAERLVELGADPTRLHVVGNLKYHQGVPEGLEAAAAAWRTVWGAHRPVWVAASTHEHEEPLVLRVHARVRQHFPDALLLWAPRHPERFAQVIDAARNAGLVTACRSQDELPRPDTQCFVIDTLGDLMNFYAVSDVAFVGGSLQAVGGHNVMEPAALGVPALVGPHTFNFAEATAMLAREGALHAVEDVEALTREVIRLLGEPGVRQAMGAAGRRVVEHERGALARTLALIEAVVGPAPGGVARNDVAAR